MSAAQFFVDRAALASAAALSFKGLVDHSTVVDKLNLMHKDTLYVVTYTNDNGCPEDYQFDEVGLFRCHDDAVYVKQYMEKDLKDYERETITFDIQIRRVY
jgi:hypothetical protein